MNFNFNKNTYHKKALYHMNKEQYDEAIYCYEMSIENNDNDKVESIYQLGNVYCLIKKNIKMAEEYYLMAIKEGHIMAIYKMALLNKKNNNFNIASKYYLMVYEHINILEDYIKLDIIKYIGKMYFTKHEYENAIKYYIEGIRFDDIDILFYIANCYFLNNNIDEAIKYFKLCVNKNDGRAMSILGDFYMENDDYLLAIKYYEMAINNTDNYHTNILYKIAIYYYYSTDDKDINKSIKYLKIGMEKNVLDLERISLIINCYIELNDYSNTLKYATIIIDRHKENENISNIIFLTILGLFSNNKFTSNDFFQFLININNKPIYIKSSIKSMYNNIFDELYKYSIRQCMI